MSTPHTTSGQPPFIGQLAKEYSLSESAVQTLYSALQRGGGSMAQFSHPDLGGIGQWMNNGMIMIGDMFNHALKAKVDALARALLPHLTFDGGSTSSSSSPAQSAGAGAWWPAEYRSPAATGGQNNFRYAYFPQANALVVEQNGTTEVYDTTGHDLSGFGQQQSSSSGFTLRSAAGVVDLSQFPKKNSAAPK